MASVQTYTFQTYPDVTLDLDIYLSKTTALSATSTSILFFHAGGLVSYNRKLISPHIVQACMLRGWPLISADYRLLPQVGGKELLEDLLAAQAWVVQRLPGILDTLGGGKLNLSSEDVAKNLVVAGASAGAFMAFLAAMQGEKLLCCPPKAILSYYGVSTFSNPLFDRSHVFDVSLKKSQVSHFLDEGLQIGETPPEEGFDPDCLHDDCSRNHQYKKPKAPNHEGEQPLHRGMLYDYLVQENMYPSLIGDVDLPFDGEEFLSKAQSSVPRFIMIHGDKDVDVPIELAIEATKQLGTDRARLILVDTDVHCFDEGLFLEDARLEKVRDAWKLLDHVVETGHFPS